MVDHIHAAEQRVMGNSWFRGAETGAPEGAEDRQTHGPHHRQQTGADGDHHRERDGGKSADRGNKVMSRTDSMERQLAQLVTGTDRRQTEEEEREG